jgi:HNH endonuclease
MASDISDSLRALVRDRARGRCEYCQTSEELSGIRCQADHILPRSRQGVSTASNLCLACSACNGHKHARTHAVDPDSDEEVSLFDPRQQKWHDHFAWNEDGTTIMGITATGRATVVALQMNDPLIAGARSLWVGIGVHPPPEE